MLDEDDEFNVDYSAYETPILDGTDDPNTDSGDTMSTDGTHVETEPESLDLDLSPSIGDAGDSSGVAQTESGDLMMPAYDLGYDNHVFEAAGNPNDTDSDGIPSSIDANEYQSLEEQVYGHYADQNSHAQLEYNIGELLDESGHLAMYYLDDRLESIGEDAVGKATEILGASMAGTAAKGLFKVDDFVDVVQYTAEADERVDERVETNHCYNLQSEALNRLEAGEDASSVIDSLETYNCPEVLGQHSRDFEALQDCTWNESNLEDVISCYESEVAPTSVNVVSPSGAEAPVGLSSFSEDGSQPTVSEPYEFDVETDMGYCGDAMTDDFGDTGGDSFDGGADGDGEY